jgi:hypothetical protein
VLTFVTKVVALLKMVWLATGLNRTLVLPRAIFGQPVSALFDVAWLLAHFDRNGAPRQHHDGVMLCRSHSLRPMVQVEPTSSGSTRDAR